MSQQKKRTAETSHPAPIAPNLSQPREEDNPDDELIFEDPYEDEMEEEIIQDDEDDEDDEDLECVEKEDMDSQQQQITENQNTKQETKVIKKVWRPGIDKLGNDEVLDYENRVYEMMYALNVEWPCLSFDVLRDTLGYGRKTFPHVMTLIAGTQAPSADENKIFIFNLSELHKTMHDDDSDLESDSESDTEKKGKEEDVDNPTNTDDDPIIEFKHVKHNGAVNRIRSMSQKSSIVANWSDTGRVHIWDFSQHMNAFNTGTFIEIGSDSPLFSFYQRKEGYALDWSPLSEGRLVSGDIASKICLFEPTNSSWSVSLDNAYLGHKASVEDLQWSPTELNVFCSCSADKTIKVWDTRVRSKPALSLLAHDQDVNVISWNKKVTYLLLSGSDDGSFKIWDLRNFKEGAPAAHFKWHRSPITSVEWHPTEESVIAVSSENQITLWDLSIEKDEKDKTDSDFPIPPQLLFIHQGQSEIKELHWHPQIPSACISTASNGFHVFKTFNV